MLFATLQFEYRPLLTLLELTVIEVTQRVQVLNRDEGHNQKSHAIRGILWTIPSLDAA